ncbi:MAG: hypothetical protein ABSG41_09295 [Bryobacteraceae bacterium]|jgi:hypothetical protein
MAQRKKMEAEIAAFPDQKWKRFMKALQTSRKAQITRDGKDFAKLHEKHYDALLARVIKLAKRELTS